MTGPMQVRRGDLTDWYVENGESVVLVGESVMVLSPLATVVLESVDADWVPMSVVVEALVARFGTPEDRSAEAVTSGVLESLADLGVIHLAPQ